MTIDRTKLIDLLIEKTSLSSDEVEIQLDQLIERIIDASERGKALEIKEFGLFFFDQDGDLKFEASEELSTEISFKYAGMKPVELQPERNTAISDDDDSSGPISTTDDIMVVPKSEPKRAPIKPKTTPTPKPASKTFSRKPIREKRDRSAVWALLAFFAVLITGALIYFNQSVTSVSDNEVVVNERTPLEAGSTESPVNAVTADTEIENNEMNADEPGEDSDINAPFEEQIPEEVVPLQDQMYGLTGELIEDVNSGYSIVIHSFYNDLRAEEVAENFRADGYRVHITPRVINGLDVWRVSLGQFESIPNAQEAAETLPEPFNENNFIQRIQPQ